MANEGLLTDVKAAVMELSEQAAVPLSKDEALRLIGGS